MSIILIKDWVQKMHMLTNVCASALCSKNLLEKLINNKDLKFFLSCKTSFFCFLGLKRRDTKATGRQRQTDVNKCNIIYKIIEIISLFE